MTMQSHSLLATVLKSRGSIVELILAAIVLGLGVNLIASSICVYFQTSVWSLALLGGSLALLGIALTARRMFGVSKVGRQFEGFVCFRRESSELIPVPRYNYTEKLISNLNSLFAENEAPKKLWDSDPVHNSFESNFEKKTVTRRTTAAGQLLIEATEYFVLETLSTHLTDYFNQSGLDEAKLKKFGREDVPSLLFKNRFLDTFSRPMHERAAFVDHALSSKNLHGKIVSAYGPGGIQYREFDLVLPNEAVVSKTKQNSITIETSKFSMTLSVAFDGFGSNLPTGFEKLYLGDLEFMDIAVYKVDISVSVSFKPFALLSRSGWDYYTWLDSFLLKLDHNFSRAAFIKHIQWDGAVTLARIVERVTKQEATQ